MKKVASLILLSGLVAGCMKKAEEITIGSDFASMAVINAAAPNGALTGTAGATSFHVYVDSAIQTVSPVTYRSVTSPVYLSVAPGMHSVLFRASTSDSVRLVSLPSENFASRQAYTYVVYDTLAAGNPRQLRSIRLTDDLTLPGDKSTDSVAKVRFLHLAPTTGAVDVTFKRVSVPWRAADSVTISNRSYIGNNPTQADLASLSAFSTIVPLGFAGTDTIRVKQAGTGNVLLTTVANGATGFTTNALSRGIVTVYLAGGAQGTARSVNVLRHYP